MVFIGAAFEPNASPAARRALSFAADEAGVTSIEYSLLASLIAVTIVGICTMMYSSLSTEYVEITNAFK